MTLDDSPEAAPQNETPPSLPPRDLPVQAGAGALEELPTVRMRPPGEQGGHTVQDWEQPGPKLRRKVDASSPATVAAAAASSPVVEDAPSPAVVPLYLRSKAKDAVVAEGLPSAPPKAEPAVVRETPLTPAQASLVEAVTRGLAEMLARSMHAVVVAAVRTATPVTPEAPALPIVQAQASPIAPSIEVAVAPAAEAASE